MKIRTCPHCTYKYSLPEYVKQILFKVISSVWKCKNCNKKITFNSKRRANVAFVFGGWFLALFGFVALIKNSTEMSTFIWIIISAAYIIGGIFIFTFDTFEKAE